MGVEKLVSLTMHNTDNKLLSNGIPSVALWLGRLSTGGIFFKK
jgi:hypothetical protein